MAAIELEDHEVKALAALCRLMCGLDESVSDAEEAVLATIGERVGNERLHAEMQNFPTETKGSATALELAAKVMRAEVRVMFWQMLDELGKCDGLAPIENALLVELERLWRLRK